LAESRPSPARSEPSSGAVSASDGLSPSRLPPTIWRACRSLQKLRREGPANCRLIGQWRIVEADLWDRAHLDLCGLATLTITAQGGEIAFGTLEAGLDVEYARDSIGFRWAGGSERPSS
jgi:hypothetical protein